LGLPKISATVSILFTVTRIPIALVLINYLGVNGIWWSISISSICKGLSVYLIYKLKIGKEYGDVKCS
ncbi:MAG: MATE family efflux transporter, partial [Clostridium sp.]